MLPVSWKEAGGSGECRSGSALALLGSTRAYYFAYYVLFEQVALGSGFPQDGRSSDESGCEVFLLDFADLSIYVNL